MLKKDAQFQSTHSLRSATNKSNYNRYKLLVSIHALLAECDDCNDGRPNSSKCFNPRTPCGVRREPGRGEVMCPAFQSTHSLRSATFVQSGGVWVTGVSIHALLAECDLELAAMTSATESFNPRTPCGVRLIPLRLFSWMEEVSIHALLAECDRPVV